MAIVVWLLVLGLFIPQSQAAQKAPGNPVSDAEKTGQKLFFQRCAACHLGGAPRYETYAPPLYNDLVAARGDDALRKFIMEGSPRMPGWRYTLKPADVEKILAYLKTVTKDEVVRQSSSPGGQGGND